eukprot:scaffold352960_cov19-Prasinocladus_malaysianus.AAC.1
MQPTRHGHARTAPTSSTTPMGHYEGCLGVYMAVSETKIIALEISIVARSQPRRSSETTR